MAVGHHETRQSKHIARVLSLQPQPQSVALEGVYAGRCVCNATKEVDFRLGRGLDLKLTVNAYVDFKAASNDRMSTQICVTTATCEAERCFS